MIKNKWWLEIEQQIGDLLDFFHKYVSIEFQTMKTNVSKRF